MKARKTILTVITLCCLALLGTPPMARSFAAQQDEDEYFGRCIEKIRLEWGPAVSADLSQGIIQIVLDADGSLSSQEVVHSISNAQSDSGLLKVVKSAQPYPKPSFACPCKLLVFFDRTKASCGCEERSIWIKRVAPRAHDSAAASTLLTDSVLSIEHKFDRTVSIEGETWTQDLSNAQFSFEDPVGWGGYFGSPTKDANVIRGVLQTFHVITAEHWNHGYSHVGGGDQTGTLLVNGQKLRWLLRPGGLAAVVYPDGGAIYLAYELTFNDGARQGETVSDAMHYASNYLALNDYKNAQRQLQTLAAMACKNHCGPVYQYLAKAYYEASAFPQAADAARKAALASNSAPLKPDDFEFNYRAWAHYFLARSLFKMGSTHQSAFLQEAKSATKIIEQDIQIASNFVWPRVFDIYQEQMIVAARMKDKDVERTSFDNAMGTLPAMKKLHFNWRAQYYILLYHHALNLLDVGQTTEASLSLQKAIELASENCAICRTQSSKILNGLGNADSDPESARSACRAFHELVPIDAEDYTALH